MGTAVAVPLLEQVKAERKGESLNESAQSKIRIAFLAGERLNTSQVPERFDTNSVALHSSMKDLERMGFHFEREEQENRSVDWWVTNPKHRPVDSGSRYRPRSSGENGNGNGNGKAHRIKAPRAPKPISLGDVFTVIAGSIDDDGLVTWLIRREPDGREASFSEAQ